MKTFELEKKKQFAYMVIDNQQGFTFISFFLMISILSITAPFLVYLLQPIQFTNHHDELSTLQFFLFVRDEVIQSNDFSIHQNELHLIQEGDQVVLKQYKDVIHRQVNGRGHEIFLRDVQSVSFTSMSDGFKISLTNAKGDTYEKYIAAYQK